jgi:hypothetical protein
MIRRRRDESFSGHPHRADIFPDGSAGAAAGYLANPVLKRGAMRRGSLDKVFIQVAIIAAIIILLTIWIR